PGRPAVRMLYSQTCVRPYHEDLCTLQQPGPSGAHAHPAQQGRNPGTAAGTGAGTQQRPGGTQGTVPPDAAKRRPPCAAADDPRYLYGTPPPPCHGQTAFQL